MDLFHGPQGEALHQIPVHDPGQKGHGEDGEDHSCGHLAEEDPPLGDQGRKGHGYGLGLPPRKEEGEEELILGDEKTHNPSGEKPGQGKGKDHPEEG